MKKETVVKCLGFYLKKTKQTIGRAEAEKRMFAKLATPRFVADIKPLVSAEAADQLTEAFIRRSFVAVFHDLVALLPGAAWDKTPEKLEKLGLSLDDDFQ
jgi:hypothetical protein